MTKQAATKRFLQYFSLTVLATTLSTLLLPTLVQAVHSENTVVGEIFDEPVYRVELRYDEDAGDAISDLQSRIVGPVLQQYRLAFQQIFEPRSYEMQAALDHLNALHDDYLDEQSVAIAEQLALIEFQLSQSDLTEEVIASLVQHRLELVEALAPPDLDQVWALVTYWKFQRHLYDVYGGGRVLIQAYGPEAIDATVNWLKLRELEGDFVIKDEALREAFYQKWQMDPNAERVANQDNNGSLDREALKKVDQAGAAEAARIAQDLRYDRNRYRLLNPGWMRALYKGILEVNEGDAAAAVDLSVPNSE